MKQLLKTMWKRFYAGWMRFAHILGIINTTILLTLVYILMIIPLRIGMFLIRKDPLHFKTYANGPTWTKRQSEKAALDERRHPF